jgi:predicted CoA-binding protein
LCIFKRIQSIANKDIGYKLIAVYGISARKEWPGYAMKEKLLGMNCQIVLAPDV